MRLIAIGRMRARPEAVLFDRYNTRLRPKLTVIELPEEKGSAPITKRKEGEALLAAVGKQALIVPLDLAGDEVDSEGFAARLTEWSGVSRTISFVIGGAEGLDAAVIRNAYSVLSFGRMTWPHFLVRVMLVEQLYRAQSILQGHPYHKAGRPSP